MSQINVVGTSKYNLSDGKKWWAYSGLKTGDVSSPATVELINIPNSGLKDSYIKIQPIFAHPVSVADDAPLGIIVKINDIEVIKTQPNGQIYSQLGNSPLSYEIFVPYQSKLEILSINTSGNNTQERGVTVLGWYI